MLLPLLWASVIGYVAFQLLELVVISGRNGRWATLPLIIMVPIFVWAAAGFVMAQTLWPVPLLLASPLALVWAVINLYERTSSHTKS